MSNSTLVTIIGPTASGKSHLAVRLARQFNGEIINCDSIQMYRRFDIGSGKLSSAEQEGIPHHLIDILNPDERYAAGEYARLAKQTISAITARRKLPIIVGGTGFYLRALIEGLFAGPTRNPHLRERLQSRTAEKGRAYLHRLLQRLDRTSAVQIHPNDLPKMIRAIEVRLQTHRPISEWFKEGRQALHGYRVVKLGLNPERSVLYEAINSRTRHMFDTGLIAEVQAILSNGVPKAAAPFQSLGYREVLVYLEGKISFEEAIQLAQTKTRQYAKRQMTWFRKEGAVHWICGFGTDIHVQECASRFVSDELDYSLK